MHYYLIHVTLKTVFVNYCYWFVFVIEQNWLDYRLSRAIGPQAPLAADMHNPTSEPQKVTLKLLVTDVIAILGTEPARLLCCRWVRIRR